MTPPSGRSDVAVPVALLVEDELNIAQLYAKLLLPWGMRTRAAATVAAAMEIIASGGPLALACVDVGLPDGSGLDVVRALLARQPSMPILIVTSRDVPADMRQTRVLKKPFTVPQFQIAIDEVVRATRTPV